MYIYMNIMYIFFIVCLLVEHPSFFPENIIMNTQTEIWK